MRVLNLLTSALALLPLGALAAKKTPGERFDAAHAKNLAAKGPIKLSDISYESLTKAPRDYSVAVLLTALDPRFSCQVCREFGPEWEMLARSWIKTDAKADSRLVFGTLDFLDGKTVFQSLGLQSAPVLLLFKPTIGPYADTTKNVERYDFLNGGVKADLIHGWITKYLPGESHPTFSRPINWVSVGVWTTAILGLITFGTVAAPHVLPFLQNRNLWAALSLLAVLLFTSGHMYNHIRKTPYVGGNPQTGQISYFAGGFQNQFGLETQIVAAMYGVLAFATISLALKVPRMTDPRAQSAAVVIWAAVLFGMYSFLLSVFRVKNGGYPFHLPPF